MGNRNRWFIFLAVQQKKAIQPVNTAADTDAAAEGGIR